MAWIALLILTTILASASFFAPYYLSDSGNSFFKNFVNQNLLSVLGVIVSITLASAANLHLAINKLQDATDDEFTEARTAVRLCCYSLLTIFAVATVLVMVKPTVPVGDDTLIALINSAVVLILVFSIGVLADLTGAVFDIPPEKKLGKQNDQPE